MTEPQVDQEPRPSEDPQRLHGPGGIVSRQPGTGAADSAASPGPARRGVLAGALAAALAGATGTGALAGPAHATGNGTQTAVRGGAAGAGAVFPAFDVPRYRTTVDGESLQVGRVDRPVAPGIVLTSFDTFGRAGWLRVHVLNADLGRAGVGVGLVAGEVSQARALTTASDAQGAVAAVNGDYFDITETYAAEGPEISGSALRKGTGTTGTVAAVGVDRIARLADLALAGTVTVAGTAYPLAALNSPVQDANGVAVFTPLWGPGNRTLVAGKGPWTELVVSGGRITAVRDAVTTTPVPDDGVIVVAEGTSAGPLGRAVVGDAVSVAFRPRTDAPVPLATALGSGAVLIRGGVLTEFDASTSHDELKPRTAIGMLDDGRRVLLVAVDGSANFSGGLGYDDMAALMSRLGARDALMLDGGGSTEIVARHAGDTGVDVVNTPSDGAERPVPNGVGLFGATGSGALRGLDVRPGADRVVPGLTLDVTAAGFDETWSPVAIGRHPVRWSTEPSSLGKVADGVLRAGRPGTGTLRAASGRAGGSRPLRVVGTLHRLAFVERAVTIEPGASASVSLVGYDADGFGAPVAARDVTLDSDSAVLTVVKERDGSLTVTGDTGADGKATTVVATVQGVTASLPVTVGLVDKALAGFEAGEAGETWTALAAKGTASVAFVDAPGRPGATTDNRALRLTYDFTGQTGTSAAYAVAGPEIPLPAGTRKLALWVNGDGQGHWLRAMIYSQGTTNVPFTFATVVDWTGWRRVTADVPNGYSAPLTLRRVYLAETSQTNKNAGALEFDLLDALVGQGTDTAAPPRPDPYVIEQGTVPEGRWTFAVLSDLHVSAAAGLDSFSGRQAAKALDQAVAAGPDFLLINGDFVDDDDPADFALANGLLRDHVPAGLPVYWTPGNHEAGLSATGGLDAFTTATGRPNRQIFDHKGTRFVLLDSHTGDMRTSDWDQVPLLRAELDRAARDLSVTGVVVSFHHPLVDPSGAAASQLSDRLEADLVKSWLADFRERSGKPVALFTGHAHTASVNRVDGVLEVTTPAVGKTPYSSPDQGGFFGWMHVAVDRRPARIRAGLPSPATREWLRAESRPLIDAVELSAPDRIAVGARGAVSATGATSEFGLVFPLRFPATVTWHGGGLKVVVASSSGDTAVSSSAGGTDARTAASGAVSPAVNAAVRAARGDGRTLAVLDTGTGTLTAVRAGTLRLSVTSGGLTAEREITLGS
ncbi:phosphodiester glycosidase family protein [Streptomyces sp. NPDC090306]|uniref:phosphodiester glycosidase family protein n=1 Tax=Streptomyces sp. NPDC090306 TaxID=3365961 RepID=UPI0037F10608